MSARGPADLATIALVQTIVPDYRLPFVDTLRSRLGERLVLICGNEDWTRDIAHVDTVEAVLARNRFFARRRLLWQAGAVRLATSADVAVLLLNPRITSNWLVLVARRLRRRRTLLWGHAWPRRGRGARSDWLRGAMRRLADTVIVYTEQEARELRAHASRLDVVAAPNALYHAAEMTAEPTTSTTDFVYVGRLNESKKPLLLLEAFRRAVLDLPDDVGLVVVGDGPLRGELEARVEHWRLSGRVEILGHVSDITTLRTIYRRSIAAVSPGYVGLSLIQSLGNGVPMLIARDEPHAPEVEAVVEGVNGMFFDSDSPDALAAALVAVADRREQWASRRPEIADRARSIYSVEHMVDAFVAALRLGDQDSSTYDDRSDEPARRA